MDGRRTLQVPISEFFHFRWLKAHQLNVGLLLDNEFIITRRKYFCQEYIRLVEEGYEMHFLDETYVNSEFLQCCQLWNEWKI